MWRHGADDPHTWGAHQRKMLSDAAVEVWRVAYLGDVELCATDLDGNDVRVMGIPSLKLSHRSPHTPTKEERNM